MIHILKIYFLNDISTMLNKVFANKKACILYLQAFLLRYRIKLKY